MTPIVFPKGFDKLKGGAKGGGLGGGMDLLGVGLDAVNTIGSISDTKKRREYEQAFQNLSLEEKKRLDAEMLKSNSQTERMKILLNAVSTIKASQEENKKRRNTQLTIAIIGGSVVLLLAVFLIKKS